MPYRHASLERGDIPRGGFFGSLANIAIRGVTGFIAGGPAGAVIGVGSAIVQNAKNDIAAGSSGAAQPIGSTPPPAIVAPISSDQSPGALIAGHQANIAQAQRQGATGRPGAGLQVPGTTGVVRAQLGMNGGGSGRRRHIRVTNVKALRRAIRRTTGFAKLAMKTIKIIHPQKKGRFGGFKRGRKR